MPEDERHSSVAAQQPLSSRPILRPKAQGAQDDDRRAEVPDEDEFIEGASRAIETAIEQLHERGIPTVHLLNGRQVKVHPDGHHEDLEVPSRS